MPRKPRIEYSGAFYHVIVRGNQKQRIFKDPSDFQKYLLTLTVYKNRMGCRIYAYVLMNNHVHLLLETGDAPLSKIMQGVNQTYTVYFNRKYRTVGHLFQGRFKAILCDRDAYLLGLVKYIHQNPLRAKITEKIDAYAWSSHPAYIGKVNPLGLVDTDQVLRVFSESKTRARREYREFLAEEETLDKNSVYTTIDQRIQGDDEFADRVLEQQDQETAQIMRRKKSLDAIATVVEARLGVARKDLCSYSRTTGIAQARRIFAKAANALGYRGSEIARYLKKDPAAVTRYLREGEGGRETKAVVGELERE